MDAVGTKSPLLDIEARDLAAGGASAVAGEVFFVLAKPPGLGGGVGYDVRRGGVVGVKEVWVVWRVGFAGGGGVGASDVELYAVAVAMGVELVVCFWWVSGGPI